MSAANDESSRVAASSSAELGGFWHCKDCRQTGAMHCATPEYCGERFWLPMDTAPRDGTSVELLMFHHTRQYEEDPEKRERLWTAVVKAYWTDFNGGGWVWNGMCGSPQGWRTLPPNAKVTGAAPTGDNKSDER